MAHLRSVRTPALGAAANTLAQLQPLIDQGYVTRSNGGLRTQIRFREGRSTLNGKLFNQAAMGRGVATLPGAPPPH